MVNTVLIALFQLAIQYGKGSKGFITSLLKYTCLCLPEEHNFPTTYSQFLKVIVCMELILNSFSISCNSSHPLIKLIIVPYVEEVSALRTNTVRIVRNLGIKWLMESKNQKLTLCLFQLKVLFNSFGRVKIVIFVTNWFR
jgi:hypothetical protein